MAKPPDFPEFTPQSEEEILVARVDQLRKDLAKAIKTFRTLNEHVFAGAVGEVPPINVLMDYLNHIDATYKATFKKAEQQLDALGKYSIAIARQISKPKAIPVRISEKTGQALPPLKKEHDRTVTTAMNFWEDISGALQSIENLRQSINKQKPSKTKQLAINAEKQFATCCSHMISAAAEGLINTRHAVSETITNAKLFFENGNKFLEQLKTSAYKRNPFVFNRLGTRNAKVISKTAGGTTPTPSSPKPHTSREKKT